MLSNASIYMLGFNHPLPIYKQNKIQKKISNLILIVLFKFNFSKTTCGR